MAAATLLGREISNAEEARSALAAAHKAKAEALFPLRQFISGSSALAAPTSPELQSYRDALEEIDSRMGELLPIFRAVLNVPRYADVDQPVDCPVCASSESLTPGRIQVLREALGRTAALDQACTSALAQVASAEADLGPWGRHSQTVTPSAAQLSDADIADLRSRLRAWGLPENLVIEAVRSARSIESTTRSLIAAGKKTRELLAALREDTPHGVRPEARTPCTQN